jgi:hypothetical protein
MGGKIKMKTKTQSNSVKNTTAIPNYRKLNNHLVKPLKSGFFGFTIILMIIIIINLLSFLIGSKEKFGLDFIDFQLAGVGFVLQVTGTSLKNFIR